ncbi:hypothetical protein K6I33_004590, partial [Streptomyces sp. UNOB3_S3]|nr:hypothetical protein [Streptomyces sp. UNOB3_S3]
PYTRAFLTALSVGHPTAGPVLDPALPHQLALTQATLPEGFLTLQYGDAGPVLANRAAPPRATTPPAVPAFAPALPAAVPAPARQEPAPREEDPLPGVLAAAHAGRHNEAAAMAAAWEQQALRRHGPHSPEACLWIEVRADLARLAGDHPRAAELWLSAASHRLDRGGPADAEALAALKRAHYCWQHSGDRAASLAPALLALWERVPDSEEAAADVRARLTGEMPPVGSR